ncbi:MAG: Lrp/AsnC family transcriptional regulator [Gammaproteobacteria bacterium]|nr:Lrp/AsnC family transcriptional regulator [Gammaproteobacteria bacterium]
MPVSITKQELEILSLLQRDATLSVAEMAEQTRMSPSPCWRRVNRLQEEGVVKKKVAILDPNSLGLSVVVFAEVKLNGHTRPSLDAFAEAIQRFPEVQECYVVVGDVDFLLKIMTRDIESYQHFFYDQLSQLEEVQEVKSMIALNPIKHTTELPLNQVDIT